MVIIMCGIWGNEYQIDFDENIKEFDCGSFKSKDFSEIVNHLKIGILHDESKIDLETCEKVFNEMNGDYEKSFEKLRGKDWRNWANNEI